MKIGVLGTGAIAQIAYLPILGEREDVELAAVSDVDPHKVKTLAERFGATRVLAEEELLADEELDAVVVSTPNALHEDQTVEALRHGKHVLVERPLALTAEGVERIREAATEAERSVLVGMSHRYRPDVAALASFVAGGELGRVYAERGAWLNRATPLQRSTWRRRMSEGGGALLDLGVPALDLCLWLVGYPEVDRVRALTTYGELDVEEAATVFAVTRDGMALTVEVSWMYFAGEDHHFARVMGLDGSGSLPPLQIYRQLGGRPLDVTPRQPLPRGRENPYTNAYRREIDHFLAIARGERDAPFPDEQAGLMRLIAAARRSAEEGREVEV